MTGAYERERQRTGNAILTKAQVSTIKWQVQHGESPRALAKLYGVRPETIRRIGREDTWSDVPAVRPGILVADPMLGPPKTTITTDEMLASLARVDALTGVAPEAGAAELTLDDIIPEHLRIKTKDVPSYARDVINQGVDSDEQARVEGAGAGSTVDSKGERAAEFPSSNQAGAGHGGVLADGGGAGEADEASAEA